MTTHIVCYSGGHSSALVAVEVVRRFGKRNVVLVNHDMHFTVEDPDIKRFKREVAEYLDLPITYVNYKDASMDQFDVCVEADAFKVRKGPVLCTYILKTAPFMRYLEGAYPNKDVVIYYGYDATPAEMDRIQRRIGIMTPQGWKLDFPLAFWKRTILATEEIGILRPATYSVFKHGNCIGCLKAGWQHWYIVYCTRPDIWLKGKWAEEEIGYAIHHDSSGPVYLEDMEPKFEQMKLAGVPYTEHMAHQAWHAMARRYVKIAIEEKRLPCDCAEGGAP